MLSHKGMSRLYFYGGVIPLRVKNINERLRRKIVNRFRVAWWT